MSVLNDWLEQSNSVKEALEVAENKLKDASESRIQLWSFLLSFCPELVAKFSLQITRLSAAKFIHRTVIRASADRAELEYIVIYHQQA